MNYNVKTTLLCQVKLLPVHTGKAHLGENAREHECPETGHSTMTVATRGATANAETLANRAFKVEF